MGLEFYASQWNSVSAPIGPVLVLAGPGAGKTRCLTGRVGYLIESLGVSPAAICAITYTNKAAQEINVRLRAGLGDRVEELTLGTIHSLCLDILRTEGERVGLPRGFGIANEEHQRLVLKRLRVPPKRHTQVLNLMGRKRLQGYELTSGDEEIFHRYEQLLRDQNLLDFDQILGMTLSVLEHETGICASLQARWSHILVDEFQDLDPCQYAIIKKLAEPHGSLFAVGDDEQSIFVWRSADPRIIRTFMRDFAISEPIVLDRNCRCTRPIFETARMILPPNELGLEKRISAQSIRTCP